MLDVRRGLHLDLQAPPRRNSIVSFGVWASPDVFRGFGSNTAYTSAATKSA